MPKSCSERSSGRTALGAAPNGSAKACSRHRQPPRFGGYRQPLAPFEEAAAMAKRMHHSRPTKDREDAAMYVAMVVRNALEDFHCRHLSDEQMKELNPLIRNAICTALHAL